jgi:hypothetical protein
MGPLFQLAKALGTILFVQGTQEFFPSDRSVTASATGGGDPTATPAYFLA